MLNIIYIRHKNPGKKVISEKNSSKDLDKRSILSDLFLPFRHMCPIFSNVETHNSQTNGTQLFFVPCSHGGVGNKSH